MATISVVSPARVRLLLLNALELFSKGSDDGKFWVQGTERTSSPVLGQRYGYCSIGAIRNVPGFDERERHAAEAALAKMIGRDWYSDYSDTEIDEDPALAEDVIVNANDAEEMEFSRIRSWFSSAASFVKK
ncbi:MAG: hypothetical protein ACHQ1D_01225 [Nitrososphaerales archaeon]